MKNQIIIHSSGNQNRIALLENGELAQLFIESEENQRTVGNIYVARVHKVMSGIRAASDDGLATTLGIRDRIFAGFNIQYDAILEGTSTADDELRKPAKVKPVEEA